MSSEQLLRSSLSIDRLINYYPSSVDKNSRSRTASGQRIRNKRPTGFTMNTSIWIENIFSLQGSRMQISRSHIGPMTLHEESCHSSFSKKTPRIPQLIPARRSSQSAGTPKANSLKEKKSVGVHLHRAEKICSPLPGGWEGGGEERLGGKMLGCHVGSAGVPS